MIGLIMAASQLETQAIHLQCRFWTDESSVISSNAPIASKGDAESYRGVISYVLRDGKVRDISISTSRGLFSRPLVQSIEWAGELDGDTVWLEDLKFHDEWNWAIVKLVAGSGSTVTVRWSEQFTPIKHSPTSVVSFPDQGVGTCEKIRGAKQ